MPITAEHINATLAAYLDRHPEDKDRLAVVQQLLNEGTEVTSRKEMRGHVTAGAILADPAGRVLFIEHVALSKWLLPGGHIEDSDTALIGAALRELAEETGIDPAKVVPLDDEPIHIDLHPIPANPNKGEGDHQHIDFRFLFTTAADVEALQLEEVSDAAWRGVESISDEELRARTRAALRR